MAQFRRQPRRTTKRALSLEGMLCAVMHRNAPGRLFRPTRAGERAPRSCETGFRVLVLVPIWLVGCEITPGGPDNTCKYDDCGGTRASLWGMTPAGSDQHPTFTISFERNQEVFPEKKLRVEADLQCDTSAGYSACVALQPPGTPCGPQLAIVPGPDPVICLSVAVSGLQVPLVDGDQYHLMVKDEAGRVAVDERWTATYTDLEPRACDNTNAITCRVGCTRSPGFA